VKRNSLLNQLKMVLSIALHYCRQHLASKDAMGRLYRRQWPGDTIAGGYTSIIISIAPYGSLYKVSQQYYLWNELQREFNWIASYGWHSNGHLMEIGGYRYCIFDPEQRQLYLEYYDNEACEKKLEIYNAI
jgi:hypothetical protein